MILNARQQIARGGIDLRQFGFGGRIFLRARKWRANRESSEQNQRFHRAQFSPMPISVIIPTHNEAARLPRLLARLNAMPGVAQIIVADGGSDDATVTIARAAGALVVEGARGRGPQQNLAARSATGEILWFLHADCLPPRGASIQIRRAIQRGAIGGNFRVHFAARGLAPRLFETIARVQRARGVYYGDSGIWISRAAWLLSGGFPDWPLFEDYELVRKLEKLGQTACCAGSLRVSARRFQHQPTRVLWLWLELQMRFRLGQKPDELARIYRARSA